jgi:hypothetical protein
VHVEESEREPMDWVHMAQDTVLLSFRIEKRPMKGPECNKQRSDYQLLKNIPAPWNPFVTLRLLQCTFN